MLTVSELFQLRRDLADIHQMRNWCAAPGVALRVLSGPLSNFHDLAANAAATAPIINVITSVGQVQRDPQNELTAEGIAAAKAKVATAAGRPHWRAPAARRRGRHLSPPSPRAHSVSRAAVRPGRASAAWS